MSNENTLPSGQRADLPHQLAPDVRAKVREMKASAADPPSPNERRRKQVTPDQCALLRYAADNAETKKAAVDEYEWVSYDQALIHINGECECDDRTHVHYDECMRMRKRAHKGAPAETLAVLNDLALDTVWVHIGGRCDHDDGYRPVETARGPTPVHEVEAD